MAFEVDLEALERGLHLGDTADALAFHGHHGAEIELEEGFQAPRLFPDLGQVIARPLQADVIEQQLVAGALAVKFFEGLDDGGVHLGATDVEPAGAFQELQASPPEPLLGQLLVEHFEQGPRPSLVSFPRRRPGRCRRSTRCRPDCCRFFPAKPLR